MIRTQLFLPKTQLDMLRRRARKKGTTVSEVARLYISQGADELKGNGTPARAAEPKSTLLKTAEEIWKLGFKGPRDLAQNMDKYLYGEDFR